MFVYCIEIFTIISCLVFSGTSRLVYLLSEPQCEVRDSPEYECHVWASRQSVQNNLFTRPCPCTLFLAILDPGISHIPGPGLCYVTLEPAPQVGLLECTDKAEV